MGFVEKLKNRWGVTGKRVVIILIVFACTGFTVMYLKRPIVNFFTNGEDNLLFTILYYLLILPIYNIILLGYGFLFGEFKWFWEFEKKMFSRMRRKKQS